MPAPKNRKWSVIKRSDIANFRLKHGLSKIGTAKALGVSNVSLTKWMKGGDPPLLSKQEHLKQAMASYQGKPAKAKASKGNAKPTAAPRKTKSFAPGPLPGVTGSKDELILQIVLEHLQGGARVKDVPDYIRQIKAALG